jgi:hypothetical protein
MATLMHLDMAMMMTKMEIYMDNSPVTEDSQYLSQGEMIGMKNDILWIMKFFIYYISNQNPILLTTGAVRIKSADYTC